MNKSDRYLIDLLLASVKEDFYPSKDINEIDFNRIYKISSLSRVSNMVYYGLLKLDKETLSKIPNLEDFKKECLVYGIKEKVQEQDMLDIIKTFEKENIKILLFKGYVLKNLYPKVDMRVMGDIDFLVEPNDIEKAQKLLESIGFKKDDKVDFNVEVAYHRNIEVELHKKLSSAETPYFDDAFDHTIKYLNYSNTYTLEINYHFVYLLSHALYHVKKGGLGIKYPLDFYLYLNKYDIDFNKIIDILIKNKLDKFTKLIILLCHKWFYLDIDKYKPFLKDFEVSDKDMATFEKYVLSGGEYGINRNIYTVQGSFEGSKFKFLLTRVFRPFRFVVKKDKPKWWQYLLLPFYYIRYWFSFFILRGKENKKKAKAYLKDKEDISDLKELFKKIM